MNPFLPALNELRLMSASGDSQGAARVRAELMWRLEMLVRRKCRTPAGRLDLANWLDLRRPLDGAGGRRPIEALAEQLLEALLRRRAEAAAGWPTIQRPQEAFDTVRA